MATIGNLVVRLTATTADFRASMEGAAATAKATATAVQASALTIEKAASRIQEMGSALSLGVSLPLAAAAVGASVLAARFEQSMEVIHTQARATQAQVVSLSQGVLQMAAAVGTTPEVLSTGLYHLVSASGVTAQTMATLRAAAEGAAMGNADLESVTNALNAAMVSGIAGIQNANQAMGVLNATVGAGDMHMQDLADALGTGVLAQIKLFGVNINQASAALAVFGDNNIRGSTAGQQLRMTVQALSTPMAAGAKSLASIGLSAASLRNALASGGLTGALQTITQHLQATGIAADQWGDILTSAFGKKAGVGVEVLIDQFSRFQTKLAEVGEGGNSFASDWTAYTHTIAFQWSALKANVSAVGIQMGEALRPFAVAALRVFDSILGPIKLLVTTFARLPAPIRAAGVALAVAAIAAGPLLFLLGSFLKMRATLTLGFEALAAVVGKVGAAFKGATLAEAMFKLMSPIGWITLAVAAMGTVVAVVATHWKQFRADVTTAVHAVEGAVLTAASAIVAAWGRVLDLFARFVPGLRGAATAATQTAGTLRGMAHAAFSTAMAANAAAQAINGTTQATQAQTAATQAAADTQAAAGNGLQSFDQVHSLASGTTGTGAVAAAAGATADATSAAATGGGLAGAMKSVSQVAQDTAQRLTTTWQSLKATAGTVFGDIGNAVSVAWKSIKTATETAWNNLTTWLASKWKTIEATAKGVWQKIGTGVTVLAATMTGLLLPAFAKMAASVAASAAKSIASWALMQAKAIASWMVMAAQSVASATVQAVQAVPKVIASLASMAAQMAVAVAKTVAGWVVMAAQAIASVAIQIAQMAVTGAKWVWMGLQATIQAAKMAAAWVIALGPVAWVTAAILGLAALVITHWKAITDATSAAWSAVAKSTHTAWLDLSHWLSARWGAIAQAASDVWSEIKDTALGVWTAIVNGIIGGVNDVIGAIDAMIQAWDRIRVPALKVLGKTVVPAFSAPQIPMIPQIPSIPHLAAGGVVASPTVALIGESGPEAVVPLGGHALTDALSRAVAQGMRDGRSVGGSAASAGGDQAIVIQMDSRTVARVLLPALAREQQRRHIHRTRLIAT